MSSIDPLHSLALSLEHDPGVYALLVGSGVSKAAGIPTGWEVTLGLIEKLAALEGVSGEADWASWYKKRYGKEADYSALLDELAGTPGERRSILHSFIEPSPGSDLRKPTKAHNAIAQLVVSGAVKVIVTTNFDRLLEHAVRQAGVEPQVIASADSAIGAPPLMHSRCTIIKVHGDYLDTRIRNTATELDSYAPEIDRLLDEVFDRFGLVVVGWSGEWDTALKAALSRVKSRRYSAYWISRGAPKAAATDLINALGARTITVTDADTCLSTLADLREALHRSSGVHPVSVSAAIALAKKYCRSDEFAVEWTDFIAEQVRKLKQFITGPEYQSIKPDKPSLNLLVSRLMSMTEVLRRSMLIAARWGTPEAVGTCTRAIETLTLSASAPSGLVAMNRLRDFPAALCFYWALAGALYRQDYETVSRVMHHRLPSSGDREKEPALASLPLTTFDDLNWAFLDGLEQHRTPVSDFIFERLQAEFRDIAIDVSEADAIFDDLEFLLAAEFAHWRLGLMKNSDIWFWVPPGRFIWKRRQELMAQYRRIDNGHPAIRAGLLGGSDAHAMIALDALTEHLKNVRSF